MYPDDAANTKFVLLSPHLHKLNEKITITLLIQCFLFLAYCLLCVLSLLWQINCTGCAQGGGGSVKKNKCASHFHVCAVNMISNFFFLNHTYYFTPLISQY